MRKFIAILFCAGLIIQNSGVFLVLAGYAINKDYISKTLCENKNKPAMHCNGKCYLAKKLKEEEKQQSPGSGNQKMTLTLQLFFAESSLDLASGFSNLRQSVYSLHNELQTFELPQYIFHPPNA